MCEKQPLVRVGVFDHEGKYLEAADVRLEPDETGRKAHPLQWDRSRGCHLAPGVAAGRYRLIGQARDHDCAERRVEVEAAGLRTVILLGPVGLPFLYRGQVKTPFQPQPDLLAIALDDDVPQDAIATMEAIAEQEKLESKFLDANWQSPRHARVFEFPSHTSPILRAEVTKKLIAVRGVHQLGPVVHFDRNESISCLTDELVVRFQPEVTRARIDDVAERGKLTMLRELAVAQNLFVFRMPGPMCYRMLDVANDIASSDLVVYAEPNLVSIGIHDTIGGSLRGGMEPTDFLFPMQWHLPLIRCPEAWRLIHDRISPDRAMGSPEVTVAVVDWGIDVDHPEFAGNLANGQPKVSAVFDFHNIAASNNGRSHGHGTCCAGVATALPDNGGGCGVAGNCRLMAIRRPEGIMASETAYSDMYLWVAGFDPKSPTRGFPQPIAPGAHVVSNSFGYAAGLPISGLMKDTFDLLTERGREGRGVVMFFSTGNNFPPVDFTLLRPWAAHARTFAVSASTLAINGLTEIRARESNFGGVAVLDFCAPSATARGAVHDPPSSHAIITAADQKANDPDPNLKPNAPAAGTVYTITSATADIGAASLAVDSTKQFATGLFVIISRPGSSRTEFNRITAVRDGTRLELQAPLRHAHPAGSVVLGGPPQALHSFSGTSCATALAAGVGALLLSACPALSWKEARDILRGTAVKIDAANADATGIWRDTNGVVFGNRGYAGPHYSRGYGFGRIDAFLAVKAALVQNSFWAQAAACITAAFDFVTVAAATHTADNPHRNARNRNGITSRRCTSWVLMGRRRTP